LKPGKRGEVVNVIGITPEGCASDDSIASRQASGRSNHGRPDSGSADVFH
jgi:hypothetical protein